jgi:hypothetical protein
MMGMYACFFCGYPKEQKGDCGCRPWGPNLFLCGLDGLDGIVKQGWDSLGRLKFEAVYILFCEFSQILPRWSKLKESVLSSFLQPYIIVILSSSNFPVAQNINMLSRKKKG